MYKIPTKDIAKGISQIILGCEWQYRINGGFIQVYFGEDDEDYEIVECSASFCRKACYDGISINKLASKVFSKETLKVLQSSNIKILGVNGEVGDELLYAEQNSDS